jgi:Asp/Glu/hydantoin racemase
MRSLEEVSAGDGDIMLKISSLGIALLLLTCHRTAAQPAPTAEYFCTIGKVDTFKNDTVACYSPAGCKFAESLGAEPVEGYDVSSAPFALARGKIAGIVTSSPQLMARIKSVKGSCRKL